MRLPNQLFSSLSLSLIHLNTFYNFRQRVKEYNEQQVAGFPREKFCFFFLIVIVKEKKKSMLISISPTANFLSRFVK